MKLFNYIIASIIFLSSCQQDLMKEFNNDDWNHERAIIDILFENQVGVATVERDEDFNGKVTFMYNESSGDPTNLTLKNIELSYGANSNIKVNDILVFNENHEAVIKVTSASGKVRDWLIKYIPFKDDLVGDWEITTLSVYGGFWPEWGTAAAYPDMAERAWNWKYDNSGPIAEYDNTLTFTLEGVTEEGDAFGKILNNAGADGKYADFIFIDDPDNRRIEIDVNNKYRKMPKGEGTWKRNSKQGTITISSDELISTGKLVGKGIYSLDEYNNKMEITDYAFEYDMQPNGQWGEDPYKDIERFVNNTKKYWIQIKKITP